MNDKSANTNMSGSAANNSPMVSVIIAVYNVEAYLKQCLESVIGQTLNNIEIICVDDGSTDRSPQILEEYRLKDSRIQIIRQEHAGAGAARNKGLPAAKGEYLSVLDSDDFFEPDMLKKAYYAAKVEDADIVVFKSDFYDEQEHKFIPCDYSVKEDVLPDINPFGAMDIPDRIFNIGCGWAWDKLFRRDFVEENNARFQEIRTSNDMFFVFYLYSKAKSIYVMDTLFAHRRINAYNTLSVTRELSCDNFYLALMALKEQLITDGVYDIFRHSFVNWALNFSLWNIDTLDKKFSREIKQKCREEYFEKLDILNNAPSYFLYDHEYKRLQRIMSEVRVSVIIPVYNGEKYIRQCLDSVCGQTLGEIQIICVNDGSTDSTADILKEYESRDDRIIVIDKEHSNAGESRNAGIELAEGEYLSFLDADDFFEPDMLEAAYTVIKDTDSEICAFRCDQFDEPSKQFHECPWTLKLEVMPEQRPFSRRDCADVIFTMTSCTAWDKLYKRSFVMENKLEFQSVLSCNDMLFTLSAYTAADKITTLDRILVHQRVNHTKTLSKDIEYLWHNFYDALLALKNYLIDHKIYKEYKKSFVNWAIDFSIWNMHNYREHFRDLIRQSLKRKFFDALDIASSPRELFVNQDLYDEMRQIISERKEIDKNAAPKVSIIIPTYNVEQYMRICLDSAVNQTLDDIEIIVVNDGSTDNCLEIIKEYAAEDDRILIIDKENGGYGMAMNYGIDKAKGEYIGIIEPDDFVDVNMFGDLYNIAVENDLDFIKADFNRFTHDEFGQFVLMYNKIAGDDKNYNFVMTPGNHPDCFRYTLNTWSGIYKRSFLEQHGIRHNETPGASFQDNGFWFQTFIFAKRAMFCNNPYYMNRRDNPNSSVMSPTKVWCMKDEYSHVRTILEQNRYIFEKFIGIYHISRFRNYLFNYNRINNIYKHDFARHFADEYRQAMDNNELDRSLFNDNEWDKIERMIEDPDKFVDDDLSKKIQVSVIVTFNNNASTIKKCIESILRQTFTKLEIICVNNCSDDSSVDIIKKYAVNDSRILMIDTAERLSSGEARNKALEYVFGKYYIFIEPDEYLNPNALKTMYSSAEKIGADIVKTSYRLNTGIKEMSDVAVDKTGKLINFRYNSDLFLKINMTLSGVMLRKDYSDEINFHFGNFDYSFDWLPCVNALLNAEKTLFLNEELVFSVSEKDNVFSEQCTKRFLERFESYKAVSELIRDEESKVKADVYQGEIRCILDEFKAISDKRFHIVFEPTKRFFENISSDIDFIKNTYSDYSVRSWYAEYSEIIRLDEEEYIYVYGSRFDENAFRSMPVVRNTVEKSLIKERINCKGSKDKAKVSVIVPVYNAESYVRKCINSIIGQTLGDVEVICINYGSTDNSLDVLKEIAAVESSVKVIDKSDKDYGRTVNLGIDMASGEYVTIINAKDYILPGMLETLYSRAVKNDLDFVMSDFSNFAISRNRDVKLCDGSSDYNRVIHPYIYTHCLKYGKNGLSAVYRTLFLKKRLIRYTEDADALPADSVFIFKVFAEAEKCMFIDKPFYFNRCVKTDKASYVNKCKSIQSEYAHILDYLDAKPVAKERFLSSYQERKYDAYMSLLSDIDINAKQEYINYIHDIFIEEKNANGLDKSAFTDRQWNELNYIIRDPEDYFYSIKRNGGVKVSVILPVYNVGKYLCECLDSFLDQTLDDIELICVNDGSTDNSLEILTEYALLDDRVVIIDQENGGAGVARNKGIAAANGEYLYFPDADDYVERDLLKKTYTAITSRNADICIFASSLFDYQTRERKPCTFSIRPEMLPKEDVFNISEINGNEFKVFMGWAWDKLYRKDFVLDNGLLFQEQRTTNDMYFVFASLFKADSITIVKESLYNQRRNNPDSLSSTRYLSWQCFYYALNKVRGELVNMGVYDRYRRSFVNYALHSCLWNFNTLPQEQAIMLFDKLREEWFENLDIRDYGKNFYDNKSEYSQFINISEAQDHDGCTAYFDYKLKALSQKVAELSSPDRKIKVSDTEIRTEKEVIEKLTWNRKERKTLETKVAEQAKKIAALEQHKK